MCLDVRKIYLALTLLDVQCIVISLDYKGMHEAQI